MFPNHMGAIDPYMRPILSVSVVVVASRIIFFMSVHT